MGGVDLDLAAQPSDAQVDRAIERLASRWAVTSNSQSRINGRFGFSAKIFNRSNSLAARRSSLSSAGSINTRRSRSRTRRPMRTRGR
jgi:hypothetical protein